jgi:hypothetical protein
MKTWQKGYELDYLLELESRYKDYNYFSLSPFSQMKKHVIASSLADDTMEITDDYIIESKIVKTKSPIKMFPNVVLAEKQKGDRVIESFCWVDKEKCRQRLSEYTESTWAFCWAEDFDANITLELAGFTKVGCKFTSFAEVISVYFKDAMTSLEPREVLKDINPSEYVGLTNMGNVPSNLITAIHQKLLNLKLDFTNHYSNYNKNKSWSALSLRGYTSDPAFITKPQEMNDKWQEENKDIVFKLQDTELRQHFPEINELLQWTKTPAVHRIRFMKLAPGDGELARHTDQVDADSGVADGKVMRLHWPITTNDKVVFNNWLADGKRYDVNMKVGECWYIDTRKPHRAINGGNEERIHLVIDVEATEELRNALVTRALAMNKEMPKILKDEIYA